MTLTVHRAPPLPVDRGLLMDAKDVADHIYCGKVTSQWVRRNVPNAIRQSRRIFYYEYDVLDFIRGSREAP